MFHSTYLYPTQQYLNLAALAEARAAEAVAKAEEAEYLAYQAALQEERALYSQHPTPFWYKPPPAYRAGQCSAHSCSCTDAAQPPAFGAYSQPLFGQRPGVPSHKGPLFPHHHGSRPYGYYPHAHHETPAAHFQSSSVEQELKAKLREETIARHRAEQELRRKEAELAVRQRQLVCVCTRNKPNDFSSMQLKAAMADTKTANTRSNEPSHGWPFLGLPQAPSHHRPLQHPQPLPSKPAPKRTDDADFRMLLASLFGAPMKGEASKVCSNSRAAKHTPHLLFKQSTLPKKVNEASKPNPSTQNQKSSPEGSLIEQLKARYAKEGHDEVRDTIKAIINSLSDNKPSKGQDVNVAAGPSRSTVDSRSSDPSGEFIRAAMNTINALSSKPSAGPTSQTNTAASSTKGKEKDTTSPSDFSSIDLKAALERVESIEHTFHHLEAEFDLPSQLDFIVAPIRLGGDASSVFPHLAFTARNHPVRYYEQTLTTLLNQLDLIESHGDATLRRRRKDVVGSIEKALDDLEREITGLWKARVEQESKKREQASASATSASSSEEETSTIKAPQPVRIPIIDLEAKAEYSTQDTEEEKDSGDLVSAVVSNTVVDQDTSNSEPTPASEEKDAEEQEQTEEPVASSPNPILAELALEAPNPSNEDDLVPTSLVAEDPLAQSATEEEEQEHVQEQGALDASEESPKEDSGAAIVDETPSIDDSHPLPEPSVITDSQQEDNDDSFDDASAEDTFLLAPPESPEVKPKLAHRQRASVEEDLGSDWSDLDA